MTLYPLNPTPKPKGFGIVMPSQWGLGIVIQQGMAFLPVLAGTLNSKQN